MESDLVIIIVVGVAAALIAWLVTWLISRKAIARVNGEREQRSSELALKAGELSAKEKELSGVNADLAAQNASKLALERIISENRQSFESTLKQKDEAHEKALAELKAAHEQSLQQQLKAIRDQMTVETEKLLKAREDELSKENKSSMDEILSPLKESIANMRKAMEDNAKEHVKSNTELREQLSQAVKDMGTKTADIGAKADNLSVALTGRPKVQGCWGENYLDDILSREGLVNGTHYSREVANEDLSRPDFVFHFKDGMQEKDLVVDSKVSLTAFVRYMNDEDETARQADLDEHVKSVRKHIEELASKDYARKVDKTRRFADYVLMFMPVDAAYRVAVAADPMLWQDAYSKGVLIATEQTIMPFLKIMQLTWNKYSQDSNILEITKAAEDMIERVALFYDSYKDLGTKLKAVCKEYNSGINKLESDGRSITTSARKVIKLGVRRSKGKEFAVPEEKIYLNESDQFDQDQSELQ